MPRCSTSMSTRRAVAAPRAALRTVRDAAARPRPSRLWGLVRLRGVHAARPLLCAGCIGLGLGLGCRGRCGEPTYIRWPTHTQSPDLIKKGTTISTLLPIYFFLIANNGIESLVYSKPKVSCTQIPCVPPRRSCVHEPPPRPRQPAGEQTLEFCTTTHSAHPAAQRLLSGLFSSYHSSTSSLSFLASS